VDGRLVGPVLTVLALAAAVALGIWSSAENPGSSTLLVLAIGIVIALPIVFRLVQGQFDPFEPTVVFALVYGTIFVAKPAEMIASSDYSFFFAPSTDVEPAFDRMLILALFGAVCFVAGYAMPFGKRLTESAPSPPRELDRRTATVAALAVVALGLLAFLLFLEQGGGLSLAQALAGRSATLQAHATGSSAYLANGTLLLVGPPVLLFALYLQRRTRPMLLLVLCSSAAVVLVRGSSGSRLALLPVLGGMFVYWYVSRGRRPGLVTSVVVIGVALIVSASIYYGRGGASEAQTNPTAGADYKAGFEKAISSPGAVLDPILKSADGSMAPGLAAAMIMIPQDMDYGYGRYTLTDLATRWIPRGLWPGKPDPPQTQVTQHVAPPPNQQTPYWITYSILLDGYLDFGMFGALLLTMYGAILRVLYEWFRQHRNSVSAMLTFSLGICLIPYAIRDGLMDTVVLVGIIFLPIFLAYRFAVSRVAR
jgi:hypothetical protein